MKKTITTVIILLLATFAASAQIYNAGGIRGFGTNTSYGARSGGGGLGSSSGGGNRMFVNLGAVVNNFASDDISIAEDLGGIGGMFEIGKGSHSLAVEYITHSYDLASTIITPGADPIVTEIDFNQLKVYVKRRQYFMDFLYLHGGTGILNLSRKATTPATGIVPAVTSDDSQTFFMINLGLGLDVNLGGFGFFVETGVNSVGGGTDIELQSEVRFEGVKAGVKILF